jgi:hypothetical protein
MAIGDWASSIGQSAAPQTGVGSWASGNNQPGVFQQAQPKQGILDRTINGIGNYFNNIGTQWGNAMQQGGQNAINEAQSAGQDIGTAAEKGNIGAGIGRMFETGIRQVGNVASVALNPISTALQPVFSNAMKVAQKIPNPVGGNFGDQAGQIIESTLQAYNNLKQQYPNAAKDLEAGMNILALLGTNSQIEKIGISPSNMTNPSQVIPQTKQAIGEALSTDVNAVKNVIPDIKNAAANNLINKAANDWALPAQKPGYIKAKAIYDNAAKQGNDISQVLKNTRISPQSVTQDGKYVTDELAQNLRDDMGKASQDLLRPSLQAADPAVVPLKVSDYISSAKSNVQSDFSLTPETKASVISKLDELNPIIEKQYPNGIKLSQSLDEKILRDMNSKYSPVGDIATNMEAVKNKALADAARSYLTNNAPDNLPIKEFLTEQSKQFQAANYLDALNGKRAPVSIATRIAKKAAQVSGAGVGSMMGGGIMGGVGGYHLGGVLEGWLESLPNKFQNTFLQNLQVTNPEAFNAVQDYIGTAAAEQATRLALPAAPIIAGAPQPESGVLQAPYAATGQPVRVPKGYQPSDLAIPGSKIPKPGQMMRTYTSDSITNTNVSNLEEAITKGNDIVSKTKEIMSKIDSGDLIVPKGVSVQKFITQTLAKTFRQ